MNKAQKKKSPKNNHLNEPEGPEIHIAQLCVVLMGTVTIKEDFEIYTW